jgi:hypothetical protein
MSLLMLLSARIATYGLRAVAEMQGVGIVKTDLKSHSPMRTNGVACGTVNKSFQFVTALWASTGRPFLRFATQRPPLNIGVSF